MSARKAKNVKLPFNPHKWEHIWTNALNAPAHKEPVWKPNR